MKYLVQLILSVICLTMFSQTNSNNENIVDYRVVAFQSFDNSVVSASNIVSVSKKLNIHVPNAFSPDGDGINDTFFSVVDGVENYSMEIYNRWGEMVFFTKNINESWDGTFKGNNSMQDAYVYIVKAKGIEDLYPTTLKGTVSLIR